MDSKQWLEKLKSHLSSDGFHIINESYGDRYFILERGQDSAVQFDIKECKGWKFALWFDFDETDETQVSKAIFFTRHKDDLDKFKPSRSFFVKEIKIEKDVKWEVSYVTELCHQIKSHSILSYCIDSQNSYMGGYGFVREGCLKYYIKTRLYYFTKKIKDWHKEDAVKLNLTYRKLNSIKKWLDKKCDGIVEKTEIVDRCSKGVSVYPRFELNITWKSTVKENNTYIEPMIIPFYHWSGKRKLKENVRVCWHYLDDDKCYNLYPSKEELQQCYGWKYKLFGNSKYDKHLHKFVRRSNNNS